jgi:sugar O-acyltransferase (sialic acid O-acetyltransferase NeuD family)
MNDLVIVGAGGHGKVVLDVLLAERRYRPVGFVDADPALTDAYVGGLPVLGSINSLTRLRQQHVRHAVVAIGDNRTRLRYASLLREQGFELASAVHPTASVSPSVTVGDNVVVCPQAAVVCEARLGLGTIVNTGAVIDRECLIGDGVHVCPGAVLAGRVRVGRGAFVGIGAQVIQCLTIGRFAVVGAGAAVIDDVPDFTTVVGVPARAIRTAAEQLAQPSAV